MAKRIGGFINQDGLNAPDEPTDVSASAGDAEATVSFTSPSDVGASAITGYVATSNDGIGATGSSSPITVTGLTNGNSYTFRVWAINAFGWSSPSDASGSVSPVAPLALFAGGETSVALNSINYVSITTTGNTSDFGDLTAVSYKGVAVGNATRSIFAIGNDSNVMNYVNPSSTGNATDFGDMAADQLKEVGGCNNTTRGLFWGGGARVNTITYVTIAATGNTSDFGDLTILVNYHKGCASSTRGVGIGGEDTGGVRNVMDYVTIASAGNAIDFGDLTTAAPGREINCGACSSPTRGVITGGTNVNNSIEYITIASTGNATDFGDLNNAAAVYNGPAAASSTTRGLFGCGSGWSTGGNTIQYITIASTGNATDFGDLTYAGASSLIHAMGTSNSHGGLA